MNKTIKLLACSKNEKFYKTTTGKIYSRHKLISFIKNNKATVTTSSSTEVSIFSFEGKEFLRSDHNNKESDNLSETLLPFNILKQHFWWLAGLLCLGIIASNIAYPLIILDHNKSHKTDLSSIITINQLGEIESDTGPAIQSMVVELNSNASDLNWSQLTFTEITPTSAHIDAKNDSKLYSGHVNVVFSIPPVIEYNVEGTNWPGYESGLLSYSLDGSNFTYTITSSTSTRGYAANNWVIPEVVWNNNQNYNVVGISYSAFNGSGNLTGTLTLANTITTIANDAFASCQNLSGQLVLPDSLTNLGSYAFYRCGFTGELVLPSNPSFTFINYYAFGYCSNFTSIIIPDNITTITANAFYEWTITSITIPNSVSSLGYLSLSDMVNLSSIVCNYVAEPRGVSSGFVYHIPETGTVQNTNSAYSSDDLLAFLKTKGLPDGWTVT